MTFMTTMSVFAMSALFFNDVLAMLSGVGSLLLCIGSLSSKDISARLVALGEWCIAPLVFGSFFQIAMIITGVASDTERIGFIFPIPTSVVTGLFITSVCLLVARWWLGRKRDEEFE